MWFDYRQRLGSYLTFVDNIAISWSHWRWNHRLQFDATHYDVEWSYVSQSLWSVDFFFWSLSGMLFDFILNFLFYHSGRQQLSNSALQSLSKFTQLRFLYLSGNFAVELSHLSQLKKLELLDLSGQRLYKLYTQGNIFEHLHLLLFKNMSTLLNCLRLLYFLC